jgi:hypothetical protein
VVFGYLGDGGSDLGWGMVCSGLLRKGGGLCWERACCGCDVERERSAGEGEKVWQESGHRVGCERK